MTEMPTMSVSAIKNAIAREHFLVAAYDSIEPFNQRIVIVLPDITEPTWVLRPGTRKPRPSNVLAVAVPSLESITHALAQRITRVATTYITVREFPREARRRGVVERGALIIRSFSHVAEPA